MLLLPLPFRALPLSYVEIYNNVFYNLLEGVDSRTRSTTSGKRSKSSRSDSARSQSLSPPPPPPSTKIEVREHPSRGVFLSGGKGLRVPVSSAAGVAELVSRGTRARRTSATGLNDRSSRSHAILIIEIEATQSPAAEVPRGRGPSSTPVGNGEGRARGLRGRRASIVDCVSIGKMQVKKMGGSNWGGSQLFT